MNHRAVFGTGMSPTERLPFYSITDSSMLLVLDPAMTVSSRAFSYPGYTAYTVFRASLEPRSSSSSPGVFTSSLAAISPVVSSDLALSSHFVRVLSHVRLCHATNPVSTSWRHRNVHRHRHCTGVGALPAVQGPGYHLAHRICSR